MSRQTSSDPIFQDALAQIPAGELCKANTSLAAEADAGNRAVASAAWWGFVHDNSTDALKRALSSGANTIIVPNMDDDPWVTIECLKIEKDNLTILLQGGTVLKGAGDKIGSIALLWLRNRRGVNIRGERFANLRSKLRVTARTNERDYSAPEDESKTGAMALRLDACEDVLLAGLSLKSSCGDGIYLGDFDRTGTFNSRIHIDDVYCNGNSRNGLTVFSASDLLVENSRFVNTGHEFDYRKSPAAGIDFEPFWPKCRMVNCVVRNCTFLDNLRFNISVSNHKQSVDDLPTSISVHDCSFTAPLAGSDLDRSTNSIVLIAKPLPKITFTFIPSQESRSTSTLVNLKTDKDHPPVAFSIITDPIV